MSLYTWDEGRTGPALAVPNAAAASVARRSGPLGESERTCPAPPARRRLSEFLDAFNSGEPDAVERFAADGFAEAAFPRAPADRAGWHRLYLAQTGGFEVVAADDRSADTVEAVGAARLTGEWYRLRVRVAAEPPHGVVQAAFAPCLPPPGTPAASADAEQIAETLRRLLATLAEADQFSGAVLLARGDETLVAQAHGAASASFGVANRVDTRFNIGSMGKMFTAVAVAQLVDRGRLAFDDALTRHLPEYPVGAARADTLHQLLAHTAGVGDFFGEAFFYAAKDRFRTVDDLVPLVRDAARAFEPGQRWGYSNGGYVLLGAVVERASGRSYAEYVRENIHEPAGMTATDAGALDEIAPNLAGGYTHLAVRYTNPGIALGPAPSPRRSNQYMIPMTGGPAGGSYSTVGDLVRFAGALRGRVLLPAGPAETVLAGERVVGHNGGAPGISGQLDAYPDADYTVAVLSNYDPPAAQRVAVFLRGLLARRGPRRVTA
jgi:D-alanyl-D-alanine carboxypeptidase